MIAVGANDDLVAMVTRIGVLEVPVPFSPVLEDLSVPTVHKVAEKARTWRGRVRPRREGG
jgi:pyruvate dehydrogenase E1 component beta subunit